jgi:23S rRNA (adenine2503-C2)-methyltransferase
MRMIELMQMEQPVNFLTFTQNELVEFFARRGEPAYRARQVFSGLHQRRLQSFEAMTDLPKALRVHLDSIATASSLTIESRYL